MTSDSALVPAAASMPPRLLDLRHTTEDLFIPYSVRKVQDLVEVAKDLHLSPYGQQALIYRYFELMADGTRQLSFAEEDDWWWLQGHRFGLVHQSELYRLQTS